MSTHRRFIAGAICPRCGELDKIYVFLRDEQQWRACVRCDFEEAMETQISSGQQELPTRVTPKVEEKPDPKDEVHILTIRDSSSN